MIIRPSLALALLTGLLLAACTRRSGTATVEGEVRVDGVPLAKGVIAFVPADPGGEPANAPVEDGRYRVVTTSGRKFVQISAPVVIDRRKESDAPDATWIEITRESLPERYNARTQLTFDAQPGDNRKDWNLTVKTR